MMKQSGLPYYLVEGLLLISGALFYTVSPSPYENPQLLTTAVYRPDADARGY
jgi:hypothetical protein